MVQNESQTDYGQSDALKGDQIREYNVELNYSEVAGGELTLRGVRSAVMPLPAFTFLLQVINEHAPEIVKYAFYDMGYRAGLALMEAMGELRSNPEAAFQTLVHDYQRMGYGQLEIAEFDLSKPEARLIGRDLFETDMARAAGIYRSPRSASHYTRGMLAGFLSGLLGREVVCEEVRAEFRGDGASEFMIMPFQLAGSIAEPGTNRK
jgi:predicted hydrocarbon binding protein